MYLYKAYFAHWAIVLYTIEKWYTLTLLKCSPDDRNELWKCSSSISNPVICCFRYSPHVFGVIRCSSLNLIRLSCLLVVWLCVLLFPLLGLTYRNAICLFYWFKSTTIGLEMDEIWLRFVHKKQAKPSRSWSASVPFGQSKSGSPSLLVWYPHVLDFQCVVFVK
jgi:hypothetical protein